MLELLLVMAIVGVFVAIVGPSLLGLRGSMSIDQATQQFSQDVQLARAKSLSTSSSWQVHIISATRYTLEQDTSTTSTPTWTLRNDRKFSDDRTLSSSLTILNAADDYLRFSTRGFGTFNLSISGEVRLSDGIRTKRVLPSMIGAVRVASL